MLNRWRQEGILHPDKTAGMCASVVGAGAIGSFTVLSLAKLGLGAMRVYDEDGVSEHNLPNQFYRVQDIDKFKVDALKEIVKEFADVDIEANKCFYTNQMLEEVVFVCTDSMSSRKLVWEEFKKQPQTKYLIEARMGGEVARMYCIKKQSVKEGEGEAYLLSDKDIKFYEDTLYTDEQAVELPCTARAIIYSVEMIASLMCRAFKSIANKEKSWPREIIFNMARMEEPSLVYMTTV